MMISVYWRAPFVQKLVNVQTLHVLTLFVHLDIPAIFIGVKNFHFFCRLQYVSMEKQKCE